jgi:serine/threonine-protein kinase
MRAVGGGTPAATGQGVIAGSQIGAYRVVRQIGEGGMGAVYLAEHALLGRRAAIKVLLPSLSARRDVVDRLFDEARATSAICDPGIVQVFDFGFHAGGAYLVMEYLDGESLDARLRARGRLAAHEALRIARQLATSLEAAHARGIVHRDLKPDNVFLVPDPEAHGGERAKLLDFGIAKLGGDEPGRARTRTGAVMGTPLYMSPEQCRGAGAVDHRADVYALGCVLFAMLTGRPPFDGDGAGDVIAAHLREAPAPPSAFAPAVRADIDSLVLRCLAKSPDERFPTMGALAGAIERVLAALSGGASAVTVALPALARPTPTTISQASGARAPGPPGARGRGRIAAAIAAVVVAAAAGIAIGARGRGPVAPPPSAPARGTAPVAQSAPDAAPPPPDAAPPAPDAAPPDAAQPPPDAAPPRAPHPRRTPRPAPPTPEDIYETR